MIKRIPLFGDLFVKLYRKIKPAQHFTTSGDYWEKRYKLGGNSGAGSYNNLAEFKGKVINSFFESKKIVSAIEFGCGDGNQLKYLKPQNYTGYDVSKKAIQLCKKLYKKDDTKTFKLMNTYNNEKAEVGISLDVIYHLIEDQTYFNYMNTLFKASKKYVIIYSSNTNDNQLSSVHVKHRKFTEWIENNQQKFKLIEHIPNQYPFDGDGKKTSFADFFIYEKQNV